MFPPPKAEDYKIDPSWKIQPGAWISRVPNKEVVGNVDRYHQNVIYWEVLKGNEIARENNELLRRIVAQLEETGAGPKQHDLHDNAANKVAADKIQEDLSRDQDHPNQSGQQAPMFISERRAGTQAKIVTLPAKINDTVHPATIEVPGASTPNLAVPKLATDSQAFVQKFSNSHINQDIYRLKKEDSPKKHWRKRNSPKGQPGRKAPPPPKPRETRFNAQSRSATAGPSASLSPSPSQARLRMPPPSAPQDDGALAPFKRRFQSSPSPASQAPSVPGPSKEGGQQRDAADPWAGLGEFFDAHQSITSSGSPGAAKALDGNTSSKLAQTPASGEGVVAAASRAASWVPPHLRGVTMPKPDGTASSFFRSWESHANQSVAGAEGEKKEEAIKGQSVAAGGPKAASAGASTARGTTKVVPPTIKEPYTLQDIYREGVYDPQREEEKKSWQFW
ncbi:MAG: hypothetical protein LQ352_007325 [Teloschistes flavicans]|nr:MAG: hypothetical protein LQ352_007325 [Teloschistes flavicans]